ncbi:hypothetical protein M3Y99_01779500 [Aphelenchoides fujianensis]|nr:hypothetical protein M3Y99_01779500 [Aphelenchoides fujianensis]
MAVLDRSGRRSDRLAAKKPKVTAESSVQRDHEWQESNTSFVYELRRVKHRYRLSVDGRYLRNAQKRLKPETNWGRDNVVRDFVVVNASTMLVNTCGAGWNNQGGLHLLRFRADADRYERVLLHKTNGWHPPTFVLREIHGREVDVKRAVLDGGQTFVFLRVDIDKAEAVVEHTVEYSNDYSYHLTARMSDDGQEMFVINNNNLNGLHVYSLAQRTWTRESFDEMPVDNRFHFAGFSRTLCAQRGPNAHGSRSGKCLARRDLRTKKWEDVPIDAENVVFVSPIVSLADGEEEGVVVIRSKEDHDDRFDSPLIRIKIERHMFRAPDSLLHHSFNATQKLQEGVEVEETLHQALEAEAARKAKANGTSSEEPVAVPQKKFFPSLYEGMEPIPICRLE